MLPLAAIALVLVFVHVGAMALAAKLLSAAVWEVSFGFGFRLARFRVGGLPVTIRGIPFGGYVRLEPDETSGSVEKPPGRPFAWLSPLERVALYTSGCGALFLLSGVVLGFEPAARSLGRGFEQYIAGAASPLSVGRGHVETATRLLDGGSWRLCGGILAAKFAAANLVPIPALNGWHVLSTIVLWRRPRPRWLDKLEPIAALAPLLLLCGWCVALAAARFDL